LERYYFKTFSSEDLINWKDEGVNIGISARTLTLGNEIAWAPTIIERKERKVV